jgi:hypothetical protein
VLFKGWALFMSDNKSNRRNAAERTAAGAGVFGVGAGARFINDNRFAEGKKPTILHAVKNKTFSGTHARYLGAKAGARAVQGAGLTVAVLGGKQVISGKNNEKFRLGHEVVRPLVGADKIEEKMGEHLSKSREPDELIRSKQRTRRFAQAGGVIGGTALLMRSPELATAVSRNSKSKLITRAQKIEPKATKASNTLLAVGGGLGAAGAFNSAHMQKLETNKLKQNRLSEINKGFKDKRPKSDRDKYAVAGGAGLAAGAAFPTLQKLPHDQGASNRITEQLKGSHEGEVKVADVRGVARGPGKRFGAERNQAKLTHAIDVKGYDKTRPIEVSRFANGQMMVTGGHHRLHAVEDLGHETVAVRVRNEAGKAPRSVVPLYDSAKYIKDVIANRQPRKPLDAEGRKRVQALAAQKTPKHIERANRIKSVSEEAMQGLKTPRNKAIVAATAAAGATAYGANKLNNKGKVSKRDDKFLTQYRDRISPSAEEGYKYLKRGTRSRQFDAAGNAALGTGLLVHAGHIAAKKRPMAALEGLGGAIALKTASDSHADSQVWNSKLGKIKAAAKQREIDNTWGKDRRVDVAKSIWVEKGLSVGLPYPKGIRRAAGIRAGHLMRTRTGKTVSVRGSVG